MAVQPLGELAENLSSTTLVPARKLDDHPPTLGGSRRTRGRIPQPDDEQPGRDRGFRPSTPRESH
jgi:hypothetical protein